MKLDHCRSLRCIAMFDSWRAAFHCPFTGLCQHSVNLAICRVHLMQACLQWCPMATPWDIQAESLTSSTGVAPYVHVARTSRTCRTSGTSVPFTWEGADCRDGSFWNEIIRISLSSFFQHSQTQVLRKRKKRKAKISLTLKCSVCAVRQRLHIHKAVCQ